MPTRLSLADSSEPTSDFFHRINFFSLDVEGAEIFVLRTIDWSKLSVHLLMVEAASNGPSPVRDLLLGVGFELEPEGTVPNSALFVNRSFV